MGSAQLVRHAKLSDMPELLRMGEEFFNASGYCDITKFNKDDTESLMISLIESRTLLTDGESSMLGFVVFPLFFNSSHLVSQELFWWVDEDKRNSGVGIKTLKKAESEAAKLGSNVMMMLSLNDLNGDKVSGIYEKLGYKKREQTHMRSL